MSDTAALDRLYEVILERQRARPQGSYVVSLLDGGVERIAAKVREEAEELIEAVASGDLPHSAHEAADLFFHTLVLMASIGLSPAAVYDELGRRAGVGGLVEKAARTNGEVEC